MAATPAQITTYLLDITDAQSDYGQKVANYYKLGRPNLRLEAMKLILLGYYVQCLEKFFDCNDYSINNFLTIAEAEEVMGHINKICKTFINLEL